MKKLLFFCLCLSCALTVQSQTEEQAKVYAQKKSLHVKSEAVASKYAGLESEIVTKLISGKIPADFPTQESNETVSSYQDRILKWVNLNQFLVKSEYRSEFFTKSSETTK